MKNQLTLLALVMTLLVSLLAAPVGASAAKKEELPTYDYMILGDAVYDSTKTSTLAQDLVKAQKGQKAAETFSNKDEKRISDNYIKFSYSENSTTDFKAASYYNPARKEVVIAFAGTDHIIKDWVANWSNIKNSNNIGALLAITGHKQAAKAEKYATDVAKSIANGNAKYPNPKNKKQSITISKNAQIVMTGHSLGGYLVQVAGIHLMSDKNLAGKFKAGLTFNSLGIVQGDLATKKIWENNKAGKYNKFVHFGTSPEFVGMYNESSGRRLAGSLKERHFVYVKDKSWGPRTTHYYTALYKFLK